MAHEILVAIATTMMCLNEVFQFAAVLAATDGSYVAAFGAEGSDALVLLVLDMHHYGFLIAEIFFGLWLVPLGYRASTSGLFPKALGVVLIVGASAIWWTCSRHSWFPTWARKSTVSWPSRQRSRRSGRSAICS
jgi:uncharacterized protein DUF4386